MSAAIPGAEKRAGAALDAWLERHTSRAPAALRERAGAYVSASAVSASAVAASASDAAGVPMAERLAGAGRAALEHVVSHPGDRSIALDLLTADALVTLALLAQAEAKPERLGAFADALIGAYGTTGPASDEGS